VRENAAVGRISKWCFRQLPEWEDIQVVGLLAGEEPCEGQKKLARNEMKMQCVVRRGLGVKLGGKGIGQETDLNFSVKALAVGGVELRKWLSWDGCI